MITTKNFRLNIAIDKNDCWLFQGVIMNNGYGQLTINKKRYSAHRIAAHQALGFDLKSKLLICHKCDVRNCCNPAHLFIGTHSDNTKDAYNKGRIKPRKGSLSGRAKIDEDDVLMIRVLKKAGWTGPTIAEVFDLHVNNIYLIMAKKKIWRHV